MKKNLRFGRVVRFDPIFFSDLGWLASLDFMNVLLFVYKFVEKRSV